MSKKIQDIAEIALPENEGKRQAIDPLRGYAYQIHQTASAWIDLSDNEELYLEIAEDYAKILKTNDGVFSALEATQIKDTSESGSVTLNSNDVLNAIKKLFDLIRLNPNKNIKINFLTTSPIGKEKDNPLPSRRKGIEVWQSAKDNDIEELRSVLKVRFSNDIEFLDFIINSTSCELKNFICSINFICGAKSYDDIIEENKEKLVRVRKLVNSTPKAAKKSYDILVSKILNHIIKSETRMLTRQNFIDWFQEATSSDIPSQDLADIVSQAQQVTKVQLKDSELRKLAEKLLSASRPSDLSLLFSHIPSNVSNAHNILSGYKRFLIENTSNEKEIPNRCLIPNVIKEHKHNLFFAPPGSGKTYSLWQAANDLLETENIIPIFLPIGGLNTWDEALSILTNMHPKLDVNSVMNNPNVCLLLDGWSEFAIGQSTSEHLKAIRSLGDINVIANTRYVEACDGNFHVWELEPIDKPTILKVLKQSNINAPDSILDLLNLPLTLILYIFLGGGTSPGELLYKFQDQLINKRFPEGFEEALHNAVASMVISGDRSYLSFITELKKCAKNTNISEATHMLEQLGTIIERNKNVFPVHDLYWSWLGGVGIFQNNRLKESVVNLSTRESIMLAQQSGERASDSEIKEISALDISLAAKLSENKTNINVNQLLDKMLKDERIAVRYRAATAVIETGNEKFIKKALSVITEICKEKITPQNISNIFSPDKLFSLKNYLSEFVDKDGAWLLFDALTTSGTSEWLPWLEQTFENKHNLQIIGIALACTNKIPEWCKPHLFDFMKKFSYKLRYLSNREPNIELARWLSDNYEVLVNEEQSSWYNINQYLVASGDNLAFQNLLIRFSIMDNKSKEYLCFAITKLGDPWIAEFQKIAFSKKKETEDHCYYELERAFSPQIDDNTARQWIENGYDQQGWRVLVTRYGNNIVEELVKKLPISFGGIHYISTLKAMKYLEEAPESIIDEIFSRFESPMEPMTFEDALIAISKVKVAGFASIVNFFMRQPNIPAYHVKKIIKLYEEWKDKYKIDLKIKTTNSSIPFKDYLIISCLKNNPNDQSLAEIIAESSDCSIYTVLNIYKEDDIKAKNILNEIKPLTEYNDQLFERMIDSQILSPLITKIFANVLNSFPLRSINKMEQAPEIKFEDLLYNFSKTSNVEHKPIHIKFLNKVISKELNIWHYRYVANMLKSYSHYELLDILNTVYNNRDDKVLFFIRELEIIRGERLINEDGEFLAL